MRKLSRSIVVLLMFGLSVAACSDESDDAIETPDRPTEFGGTRPVTLQVPSELEEGRTYPLLLILHGYGANGYIQQAYLQLGDIAQAESMFVLAPNGTIDGRGSQFWNADPVCCDFGNTQVDDVAYLSGLIAEVSAVWPIDAKRVQVLGHSNGAFMAYRLACDRANLVSAIAGLAGGAASTPENCNPSQPVHVLHMHGTNDQTVPYLDNGFGPGAIASAAQWAAHVGCTGERAMRARKNLDSSVPGDETTMDAFGACPTDGAVELWTIEGGSHLPQFDVAFRPELLGWFAGHTR